ncbi:MAG: TetR/AcrR family transcriptional regulator [Spirochaetales bacterium]
MARSADPKSKHRILKVAGELFAERGYDSVRLIDIAQVLDVKHAALYYHFPGGKKQLYLDVMKASLTEHQRGMEQAITEAEPSIASQLRAVAGWLTAHPPLNVARMELSDFPAIGEEAAAELRRISFDALRLPLRTALSEANDRGETAIHNVDLAALSFVTLVEALHSSTSQQLREEARENIEQVIDMLLRGWLPR